MKRAVTVLVLLLAMLLLASCGAARANDGASVPEDGDILENAVAPYDPYREARDRCYKQAYRLLPKDTEAKFHDFIVDSDVLSGAVELSGYTVMKDGDPDLHVRVGTADPAEDYEGNNCYYDFLYNNKDGYIVAYKFSWKEGYGPGEAGPDA